MGEERKERDKKFFHALEINTQRCTGCSHCVSVCPTEAIRVKNGKSLLVENHCIDCGECIRVCPTEAIYVNQDDFNQIFEFKYRVALIPSVFLGQFPEDISLSTIYNAILKLGFTHVYEAENGVEILEQELLRYQEDNKEVKPLLSTFCPAIVRLIQVRFPSLVDNLVLQKTPLDISAMFVQKQLLNVGVNPEEIGIFYITPCAAKIVAIKDPVGEQNSAISGAINMDVFFNKIYGAIKRKEVAEGSEFGIKHLSDNAIKFSLTGGEAKISSGRSLSIDGIQNVIDFLEKIEIEEIENVDFLELRACDESCADGVLTSRNKFLTVERMTKCSQRINQQNIHSNASLFFPDIKEEKKFLIQNMKLDKVSPRSMVKLDDDIAEAIKKMEKINKILALLPNVDCTMCGTPNCRALAQDIALGKASIEHCIFIQKSMEQAGELSQKESAERFQDIWGPNKTKQTKNIEES